MGFFWNIHVICQAKDMLRPVLGVMICRRNMMKGQLSDDSKIPRMQPAYALMHLLHHCFMTMVCLSAQGKTGLLNFSSEHCIYAAMQVVKGVGEGANDKIMSGCCPRKLP